MQKEKAVWPRETKLYLYYIMYLWFIVPNFMVNSAVAADRTFRENECAVSKGYNKQLNN